MPTNKAFAAGGVVINDAGQVLLVEPKGHVDGYVWTFPKGRPEPGETAEETALREVLEESGVRARILGLIPKVYEGGTTQNLYFLMRPIGETGTWCNETNSTCWANPGDAAQRIAKTTNLKGQQRDLAVLKDALALMRLLASAP